MSDYMADLSNIVNVNGLNKTETKLKNGGAGKSELDMNDYLKLMVAMFQNQSMDDTADIGEMMSNMVQMSVVEAITSISSLIEQSTSLNYAASLVGKEVTVGEYVNGKLVEHVGTVTATGTYDGQQVVFLGDDCYFLNSVMAVGRLPAKAAESAAGAAAANTAAANTAAVNAAANAAAANAAVSAGQYSGASLNEASWPDGIDPYLDAEHAARQAAPGTDEAAETAASGTRGTESAAEAPSAREIAEETLAAQGSEAAAEEAIT